jgi:hypothetical protein
VSLLYAFGAEDEDVVECEGALYSSLIECEDDMKLDCVLNAFLVCCES